MKDIPEEVESWLNIGGANIPLYELKTFKNSEIENFGIVTGVVGNQMNGEIRKFVEEHSKKNYFAANKSNEHENTLGDLAIPFDDRDNAEKFHELVEEAGGHLRLSSKDVDGWFLFEAE